MFEDKSNAEPEFDPNGSPSRHPALQQYREKIENLEKTVNDLQYRLKVQSDVKETVANQVKMILTDNVPWGKIDKDVATEIAEALGIEAERDVAISGTVSFSGTITVSLWEEFDEDDIRIEDLSMTYNGEEVQYFDYDLENVSEA